MQKEEQNVLQARFTVWLKKLIVRAKINYIKRLKRNSDEFLDDYEENRFGHDFSFGTQNDNFDFEDKKYNRAISKLSESKRNILISIYIKNMSAEEIAKESGVTVQHIYNQHSLAIKQLKSILSKGKNNEKY